MMTLAKNWAMLLSAEIIISFHSSSWQKINKGIGYPLGPAYRFPVVGNSTEKIKQVEKKEEKRRWPRLRYNNKGGKEERKCWRRWRRRGIMCIWVPSMHLTVHTISPACQPVRCPVKTKRKNSQKLAELSESENENFDQNIRWWAFRKYECVCVCIKFRASFLQQWS